MITFQVPAMTCGHCARTITAALQAVDSAGRVNIDLPAKRVVVVSSASAEQLKSAIENAGYDVSEKVG
jgi:copper chaperone